ncbi:competence protein CoiA family protein [Bacillus sp. 165]|uniref:competence protein CoiA n=1 Tax=Bacillus sp. 165 TaxID=1529117 RepID=UPI001AD989A9|nr:competence protein CoiA family protein [Bacillus sp. 165]MBO9128643.1 competence protein [Bacillus sp. 165]
MLVAVTARGECINVLDHRARDELVALRKQEQFICPSCQQCVRLKIGEKKQPHFAHVHLNTCQFTHESLYHMQGKAMLYLWLQQQGYTVELEKYLPSICRRPDLFMEESRTAVEFQCSLITKEQFMKRTESYQKQGVNVVWILGGNQYKRYSAHWIRLSSFQAMFSYQNALFYFCPRLCTFTKCTPLIPFSPTVAFSHSFVYPLKTSQFSQLFQPNSMNQQVLKREWMQKKIRWRTHSLQIFQRGYYTFLQKLYTHHIPPSLYPPEAGIPLPSLLSIQTPAIIWQTYILLDVIGPLKKGEYFSLQQVYNALKKHMKERTLPYVKTSGKQAVEEYLQFLVSIGMIKHVGVQKYKKIRNCTVLKTAEEAVLQEEEMIQKALELFVVT